MYLVPIGDIHLGSTAFGQRGREKLSGYLDWIAHTPHARFCLMGDIFDVATRHSATPPFESNSAEYKTAVQLFAPYAKKCLFAIRGNHCQRLLDFAGYDVMEQFCNALGVPYLGLSAVVHFDVGKEDYTGYFHHSTGGGGTVGGALNRAVKLQDIVQGVDFYCIGHNHNLATAPRVVYHPNKFGTALEERCVWFVDCGSYLDYPESYAELKMLAPGKLGSPRIRLDGKRHDIHVSL